MMQWFSNWAEEEPVSINWAYLEQVSSHAKTSILKLIAEQGIVELEAVLRAWLPYESDPIRVEISATLDSLDVKEVTA